MVISAQPKEHTEVRCPYCNDFWGYITDDWFWMEEDEDTIHCRSSDCGKPFKIVKQT